MALLDPPRSHEWHFRTGSGEQRRAPFVVVLGPDGAGKSTLLRELADARPAWACISADPEHLYPLPDLPCYDWPLRTHPREFVPRMRPLTRAAFYLHTLAVEVDYHITPALADGRTVVCDSYWYRFLSKERLQNPTTYELLGPIRHFLPRPDLIVWLELSLETAWDRLEAPTVFEVPADSTRRAYVSFQREVLVDVRRSVAAIEQVKIDASMPRADVAAVALDIIEAAGGEAEDPARAGADADEVATCAA